MNLSIEDMPQFIKAYNEAVKNDKSSFIFKGIEYYTLYAHYLIEYFNLPIE